MRTVGIFGVGFTAIAAAAGAGGARPEIDYLMLVGSSTTDQTYALHPQYGRQEHAGRLAMTTAGMDIPIICKAVGGSTVADLDANINSYMTSISGLTGKKLGVLVNIGSNDIGTTGYESATTEKRAQMDAGLSSIIAKIIAAGHVPILATCHSRCGVQSAYESWAVNLYRPKALSLTPDWCVSGAPAFDYCQLYASHQAAADNLSTSGASILNTPDGVSDWWQTDNTHPLLATSGYQNYTSTNIALVAKSKTISAKESFIFGWTLGNKFVGGLNLLSTINGTASNLYNNRGQQVTGTSLTVTNASARGVAVRAGVGNQDVGISNLVMQEGYIYNSFAPFTITFNGGSAYANKTGTAYFTFNTTNAGRTCRYTIGAASAEITGNTAGLQVASVPFTADASGGIAIAVSIVSGDYASVNGIQIEFD